MCPDRHVVADDVVLAYRRALSGLEARPDAGSGVDRGERADHRPGPDDELALALLLSARRATDDRVLADGASLTQPNIRRHERRRVNGRRHARTASSRYATRAPPDRRERMASSSTRTTMRPASPSVRGFFPSRTQSMK